MIAQHGWRLALLLITLPTLLTLGSVVVSYGAGNSDALAHLVRYVLPGSLLNSLALTAGVCVAAAVIGVALAWLTVTCDFPLRGFFAWALFLPMAVPGYVMAFAFVGLFEYAGTLHSLLRHSWPELGWLGNVNAYPYVVLVLALVLYPYVYLLARNAFQTLGQRSIEAGQSLGLSVRQSFFKVALPLARPWIVGGVLLVAMETLADFGTVAVFNYDTLTTAIYQAWFSLFSIATALNIAGLLLLLVIVVIVLERYSRRQRRYAEQRNSAQRASR
ncbi:MAG: iron ABC transporter permease, partial [Pseudomonadales bacterium]|nr:iron ABC transporter permease [Pseudomonadales bacterium]